MFSGSCHSASLFTVVVSSCIGASVFTDGDFPLYMNHSLFTNITCSSDAEESSLAGCDHYETECLPYCENNIVLRCYSEYSKKNYMYMISFSNFESESRQNYFWQHACPIPLIN